MCHSVSTTNRGGWGERGGDKRKREYESEH